MAGGASVYIKVSAWIRTTSAQVEGMQRDRIFTDTALDNHTGCACWRSC